MWHICFKTKNLKYSYFFSATDGQFKGVSDVFSHLMKTEGPKALYKGAAPVFVRAFVANSCCFMGYEVAMWGLNKAMWWKKKKHFLQNKLYNHSITQEKKHNGVKRLLKLYSISHSAHTNKQYESPILAANFLFI